jgi:hypothetical protein
MAAKNGKPERRKIADFDPRSVEPFAPFTVRIDDPEILAYLAQRAARDAWVASEVPATGPEQARASLATARGRDVALWDYAATGGPKAKPGSRIAYAPLDPRLQPERQAVKDAAAFGMSILPDTF